MKAQGDRGIQGGGVGGEGEGKEKVKGARGGQRNREKVG